LKPNNIRTTAALQFWLVFEPLIFLNHAMF
jgi:hypothetical protein